MCESLRYGARASVLSLGLLAASCRVYDPSLVEGGATGAGCTAGSRQPPPPPDGTDAPASANVAPLVFALKELSFDGQFDAWHDMGIDLDETCSSTENGLFECAPPGANPVAATDGPRGVDNVFASRLYPLLELVYDRQRFGGETFQEYFQAMQERGRSVFLTRLLDWNGLDDDPRVTVEILLSVFGAPGDGSDTPPDATDDGRDPVTSDPLRPTWKGDDWFWTRSDMYVPTGPGQMPIPRVVSTRAWVRDRVVVAILPDNAAFPFEGDELGARIELTDAVAFGRLADDLSSIGPMIIAGRWSRTSLLAAAAMANVCPGSGNYNILTPSLDNMLDLRSAPGSGGEGVACDAISLGVTMTGHRARIADIVPAPPSPAPCD